MLWYRTVSEAHNVLQFLNIVKITRLENFFTFAILGLSKHDKGSTSCTPPIHNGLFHGAALIGFLYQRIFRQHLHDQVWSSAMTSVCEMSVLTWLGVKLHSVGKDRGHLGQGGGEASFDSCRLRGSNS